MSILNHIEVKPCGRATLPLFNHTREDRQELQEESVKRPSYLSSIILLSNKGIGEQIRPPLDSALRSILPVRGRNLARSLSIKHKRRIYTENRGGGGMRGMRTSIVLRFSGYGKLSRRSLYGNSLR